MSKVAKKYANSFIDSVLEKRIVDTIVADIEFITSTFDDNPALKNVIESPVVKSIVKRSILEEIFKNRIHVEMWNFILFIVNRQRENILYDILKQLLIVKDERLGIIKIHITSSVELNERQLNELKNSFEKMLNKKVVFKTSVDSSIIGGFVARYDDTVVDASIKHQLEKLKKEFMFGGAVLN